MTLGLGNSSLLPAWVVLPMALLTLLVISAHVHVLLGDREMPPSRRRIRLGNGVLMLFATPLIAFAFGILRPVDTRTFTLVWTAIVGILLIVILLAGLDALNTVRLHSSVARQNRRRIRSLRAELAAVVLSANNARVETPTREPATDDPHGSQGPGTGRAGIDRRDGL